MSTFLLDKKIDLWGFLPHQEGMYRETDGRLMTYIFLLTGPNIWRMRWKTVCYISVTWLSRAREGINRHLMIHIVLENWSRTWRIRRRTICGFSVTWLPREREEINRQLLKHILLMNGTESLAHALQENHLICQCHITFASEYQYVKYQLHTKYNKPRCSSQSQERREIPVRTPKFQRLWDPTLCKTTIIISGWHLTIAQRKITLIFI